MSATFAASLVTSPAIGAYLSAWYGDNLVVLLATLIALADICFILLAVPESLPDKMRLNTWGAPISWEQADPFAVSNQSFTAHYLNGCLNNESIADYSALFCRSMKSFSQSFDSLLCFWTQYIEWRRGRRHLNVLQYSNI